MKKTSLVLTGTIALLSLALCFGQGAAQSPSPAAAGAKIAVCDVVGLFNAYERARDIRTELDLKEKQITATDEGLRKKIERLQEQLESLAVDSKEYESRLRELSKLTVERMVSKETEERLILQRRLRETEQMYREILDTIASVANERGFHVVIHREEMETASRSAGELLNKIASRKCLYWSPSIDITAEVMDRLNKKYREKRK